MGILILLILAHHAPLGVTLTLACIPYPSHLQHRASSGQHGAYVKQGSPNHRGGPACRRDLASGNVHGTSLELPWNSPGAIPGHMRLDPNVGKRTRCPELPVSPRFTFRRACHTKVVTNIPVCSPFHTNHWWIHIAKIDDNFHPALYPASTKGLAFFAYLQSLFRESMSPSLPLPALTLHCNLAAPTMTATVTLTLTLTTTTVSQGVRREQS